MTNSRHASPQQHRANTFARLFEAVHEGVFIGELSADPNGPSTTIAANPHLKLILGYTPETPERQVAPFAAARFIDEASRASFFGRLLNEGAVTDYLLRLRRLDGDAVWVEVTARADSSPDSPASHVEALIRNVSERRKLDDQSRDLYQQLLQAEKMAALGQTISGVAHELNNPLATILSWSERLAERSLDETARRGVAVIRGEAERAARIVRNLLTFSRKRQSTRALVDLNQVVRETIALRAYGQHITNIDVVMALASGLPAVLADAHQVQQVLLNLVINAEQAMLAANGRGSLVLRTWHEAERATVVLQVTDDGPGVPGDVKSKIFDPFFTTKETGKGTGLGLTVAYAIVQEHGGSIRVDSPETGGASFTVELPVTVESAAKSVKRMAPLSESAAGASVLLVEDERALAAAVGEALIEAGLNVDHAGDGEEALARVRQNNYDVVICDLKMPRVDGISLYRAIAAATPALARRVIFVTGDVAGADAERFLEESGCRWLAKPFRLADLLRSVREALA
ncbi:MAG TPA: ATP-binding protein [Vicinamibacterales bacterium]|nr:ATP-binding protein [Vicinamibacterales bacterium]